MKSRVSEPMTISNSPLLFIIPCYNEGVEDLENCVRSALDQDYPFPFQVILVDDGSKDKSAVEKHQREVRRQ